MSYERLEIIERGFVVCLPTKRMVLTFTARVRCLDLAIECTRETVPKTHDSVSAANPQSEAHDFVAYLEVCLGPT